MWFNKGDQNSLESGLKRPMGNELCRRLHPNDSRNPFSFTVVPQGVMVWGRGTASAVDRVLSLIVDLRCISSFSFIRLEPYPAGDTRETCHPQTFGHRPIYICGEAATTTLNLKKPCQAKPLDKSIFLLYNNIRCGDELCLLKTS